MPQDAKLGLMIGVGVVVVIAVVFFRKEATDSSMSNGNSTPAAVSSASVETVENAPAQTSSFERTSTRVVQRVSGNSRRHVVQKGDTLYTLSIRYYNDESRSLDIYQANREKLSRAEGMIPGMVLVIPEVASGSEIFAEAKRP
ncbi:MAG: LysM peptidoglycan-binding domain-containing protein [Gemmataceae bacterium]